MSKPETKKSLKNGLVIKGFLVLLSLILLIFISSFAWFKVDITAKGSGLSVKTEPNTDFDISIGYKSSSSNNIYRTTPFSNSAAYNLRSLTPEPLTQGEVVTAQDAFADFQALDVTSDGVNFYRPSLKEHNSKVIESPATYKEITPGVQYLWFDLILKSRENISVKLSNNAFAKGIDEQSASDAGNYTHLIGSSVNRKSEYSSASGANAFSTDCIVGAIRLSFVPVTLTDQASIKADVTNNIAATANCIWIPRPDLQIHPTTNQQGNEVEDGTWTMDHSITSGVQYQHKYHTYTPGTPNTFVLTTYDSSKTITGSYNCVNGVLNNTGNTVVSCNTKIGDYYYGKTRVFIWIEGDDTEARKALVTGQFDIGCILSMS